MSSFLKAFLALGLLSCAGLVQAAPITLYAEHFSVTYDDAQAGLYKQGALSGSLDTVYFLPNTFSALSGGNEVGTQASLQLTFEITTPGHTFAGFTFTERGDYFLFGGGAVDVAASVLVLNDATSESGILEPASGPFDQTGISTPWELVGSLTSQELADMGSPQTLVVTLDNTLQASSSTGGIGFIQKTYAGFRMLTEPAAVPEPSSLALLLAGIMAALLIGRRQRVRTSIHGCQM